MLFDKFIDKFILTVVDLMGQGESIDTRDRLPFIVRIISLFHVTTAYLAAHSRLVYFPSPNTHPLYSIL